MFSKQKRIGLAVMILSFLACYLEWGQGQRAFIYQVAVKLFQDGFNSGDALTHPLVLLPFAGLLLLLYCLFASAFSKKIFLVGTGMVGLLVFMVLLSGILSANLRMVLAPAIFFGAAAAVWWRR